MRGPWKGAIPAAMQRKYDALAKALGALPTHQPTPVAGPIFGDGPRPPAPTIPAEMPPALASAFANLQVALDGPPCLDDQWPFANPPAVRAAIDAAKSRRGRPPKVGSHQVIVFARFIRLGRTLTEAAKKAGIDDRVGRDIRAGKHPACMLPAVAAAGIVFPLVADPTGEIPGKSFDVPSRPEQAQGKGVVATTTSGASNATDSDPGKAGEKQA